MKSGTFQISANSRDTTLTRPATKQGCYKSGLLQNRYYVSEYHEIKGVDGELWLRVKLE
jgi:hypothetical protein